MSNIVLNRKVTYTEIPPFPKNMLIEVTNACNQRCVFCPQKIQHRKIVNIRKELVFKVLEEAYDNGTREVGFYMNGESLLNIELNCFIEKAARTEKYEYVYLTTNGVLATVERVEELENAGLSSIKISINAATGKTYKYIHGTDDFDKVKQNISELYKARKEGKIHIPIFLSFVTNDDNRNEVELLYQQFGNMVDDIYVHDANNRAGIMTKNINGQQQFNKPCEMLFNRIHVNSSGFLTACCSDYHGMLTIADLRETTLVEAWKSTLFCEIRKQHLQKQIGNNQCYNCIYNVDRKDIEPLNKELYDRDVR